MKEAIRLLLETLSTSTLTMVLLSDHTGNGSMKDITAFTFKELEACSLAMKT
jgi:hypothetical protein